MIFNRSLVFSFLILDGLETLRLTTGVAGGRAVAARDRGGLRLPAPLHRRGQPVAQRSPEAARPHLVGAHHHLHLLAPPRLHRGRPRLSCVLVILPCRRQLLEPSAKNGDQTRHKNCHLPCLVWDGRSLWNGTANKRSLTQIPVESLKDLLIPHFIQSIVRGILHESGKGILLYRSLPYLVEIKFCVSIDFDFCRRSLYLSWTNENAEECLPFSFHFLCASIDKPVDFQEDPVVNW